jgi:hypothetical protein
MDPDLAACERAVLRPPTQVRSAKIRSWFQAAIRRRALKTGVGRLPKQAGRPAPKRRGWLGSWLLVVVSNQRVLIMEASWPIVLKEPLVFLREGSTSVGVMPNMRRTVRAKCA